MKIIRFRLNLERDVRENIWDKIWVEFLMIFNRITTCSTLFFSRSMKNWCWKCKRILRFFLLTDEFLSKVWWEFHLDKKKMKTNLLIFLLFVQQSKYSTSFEQWLSRNTWRWWRIQSDWTKSQFVTFYWTIVDNIERWWRWWIIIVKTCK